MPEDTNIENQTLDKIEHPEKPEPKKVKRRRSIKPTFDLIIALILTLATIAMIAWWYLEISKIS